MLITMKGCGHCGADLRDGKYSRMVAIVDRDMDCVVAHQCPDCGTQEKRPLSEILAVADPLAFHDR